MNRQHGLTLLEMMIALTIGLFIIAGVGQIFISTRAAYNNQERIANLQENGRFALMFLQRSLRKAGYPKSSALNAFTSTPSSAACPVPTSASSAACPSNAATSVTATCNDAGSVSDQVAVCYQGTLDCLGQDGSGGTGVVGVVTDQFFVATDAATGVSRLMCRGFYNGIPNANGQAQPLVDGVENLQVQYGQDTDNDGSANRYVRADQVTNWDAVVSVRVAALASTVSNDALSSGGVYGDTASDALTYQVLETSATLPASAVRAHARGRVFVSTIEVRNRTP